MPKKTKARLLRDTIREDLLGQLERNGTAGAYYTDLVEDYMELWDTKNKLTADIRARGVTVDIVTSAGTNQRKNDSVGELVKLNAQMLKLLDSLGVKPAPAEEGGGGRDEEM